MIVINIIIKDLKTILSDKKALAVIIIMPLVLMTILSFALKGSFTGSDEMNRERVNIAIVKQYDKNKDSQMFKKVLNSGFVTNMMGEDTTRDIIASIDEINPEKIFFEDFLGGKEVSNIISYRIEEESNAMKLMESGEISAVVVLPEKFAYDMEMNLLTPYRNNVGIKILTHQDKYIDGEIVKAVVEAYSNAISSIIIGKNVLIEASLANNIANNGLNGINKVMNGMKEAMEGININIDNVTVEDRKHISSSDYYSVAIMTMFILFAASFGSRMLLEEKDNKTYQRMIIAGVSSVKILIGKFFTIFLVAIIQIIIMIIFSHFALKVQWGNLNLVLLISLISAFAVASIGAFVAALTYRSNNYKMANIFESIIIQGMAILGGSFFPIDVMPEVLRKFSFLSVNGIALKSYLKIMVGYGIADVINYIVALAGIGILFSVLAVLILKEKGEANDVQYNKVKTIKA